ncbi:hypothetical protein ACFE04_022375 [Oxalis oulophora]
MENYTKSEIPLLLLLNKKKKRKLNDDVDDTKPNRSSDHDDDDLASVSCCSSNGSSDGEEEEDKERAEFVDLEVNETSTSKGGEEEERITKSLKRKLSFLDSTTMATVAVKENSGRRKSTVVMEKMNKPLKLEIEEFFAEAEKNIQKEFSQKYNFDIAKDKPLQGRYQWVGTRQ